MALVFSETSMKPIIIAAAMLAVLLGGTALPALAQRSEAGDRGLRLENDALRTDVRRERPKKPSAKQRRSAGQS
jgi:hypothetical protein